MCLMVWVGSERPFPSIPGSAAPDPVTGYERIEPVAPDAPVRTNVASPFVSYVGSHEGCGCGFNSATAVYLGYDDEDELEPVLGALLDDERAEHSAERASRERLHALVEASLVHGAVVIFACWAGAESEPPVADELVDAGWLLRKTAPLREGMRYTVRPRPSAMP